MLVTQTSELALNFLIQVLRAEANPIENVGSWLKFEVTI